MSVRDHQTFWLGAKTNLKGYNPTAPDAVLPALADISAYLYNDQNTDPLIKAALVHYQFEMIHPFERYNGIVGRIIVPIMLSDVAGEAKLLICLSEYLYHNKNEYFDLLRSTQYSGGYIRWIKFFLNAVRETVKQTAKTLLQYEHLLERDQKLLSSVEKLPPSIFLVYECLKKNPSVSSTFVAANINLSFNTISKDMHLLKESGIITKNGSGVRNHIWEYKSLYRALEIQEYSH